MPKTIQIFQEQGAPISIHFADSDPTDDDIQEAVDSAGLEPVKVKVLPYSQGQPQAPTKPPAKTQYGAKPLTGMQIEAEEQYPDIYSTSSPQYAKGMVQPDTGVIGKAAKETFMTTEAALGSLPASAWKMMTGLVDMAKAVISDPQKAGEGAVDVAQGLYGLAMKKAGKETTVTPEQMAKAAEFAKSMTDKYSSPEKFRQSFMEDPAPILADAAMVAPVGVGAVKGIAKASAPVAKVVANTGEALKTAAAQGLMKSAREQVRVASDFPLMNPELVKRRSDFILMEKLDATPASVERIPKEKTKLLEIRNKVSEPIAKAPTDLTKVFDNVMPEKRIAGAANEMDRAGEILKEIQDDLIKSAPTTETGRVSFRTLEAFQTRLNERLTQYYKGVEKGKVEELTPTAEKMLVNIRDNVATELRRVAETNGVPDYGAINERLSGYIDVEPIVRKSEHNTAKARKSILEESIKILAGGAGTGAIVGGVPGAELGALAGAGTSALLWLTTKPSAPFTRARLKLAIARATDSEIDKAYKMSEKLFATPEAQLTPKENVLKTKITQLVDFMKAKK